MVDPPRAGDAAIDRARAALRAASDQASRAAALQREAEVHIARIALSARNPSQSPDERARRVDEGALSIDEALAQIQAAPLDAQREAAEAMLSVSDVTSFRATVAALRWQLDPRAVIERGFALGGPALASELARGSLLPSYEVCSLLFSLGGHALAATHADAARSMLAMPLEGLDAWTWALQLSLAIEPSAVRAQVLAIAEEIDAQARAGALDDRTDSDLDPRFAVASAMVHLGEHGQGRAWLDRGLRADDWPSRAGWSAAIRAVRRGLTPEQDRALGQQILEEIQSRALSLSDAAWRALASALDPRSSQQCLASRASAARAPTPAPRVDLAPWIAALTDGQRQRCWPSIARLAQGALIEPATLFAWCPSDELERWARAHQGSIDSIECAANVLRAMEPGATRATLARQVIERDGLCDGASSAQRYAVAAALEDEPRALRWLAERAGGQDAIALEELPPRALAQRLAAMLAGDRDASALETAPWSTLLTHLDADASHRAIAARCAAWVLDRPAASRADSAALAPSTVRALVGALTIDEAERRCRRAIDEGRGALAHSSLARVAELAAGQRERPRALAAAMRTRFTAVAPDAWARVCWRWIEEAEGFEWPAAASPDVLAQSYERDLRCFAIGEGALAWGAQFDAQRALDWAALLWPRCSAAARERARSWLEPAYAARRRVGLAVERWLAEALSVERLCASWAQSGPGEPRALLRCAHELQAMGGADAVDAITDALLGALTDAMLSDR